MSHETQKIKVIRCRPGHELIMANYHAVNEEHFRIWSPASPKNHHSIDSWKLRLEEQELRFESGLSAHFIGTDETESYVIGSCSISNIVRGVFQACHMGYSVAERFEGQGKMRQIVSEVIDYAFIELKLHRIMANHMPSNTRSGKLLESLGFEREGLARDYLYINGRWEDHVLTSLINKNHRF